MSNNYPSASDYLNSIQNPKLVFKTDELRNGQILNRKDGLPIYASGAFAIVFKLESKGKTFAIRCFHRPITNQRRRYGKMSQYLLDHKFPAMLDFKYIPQGIFVKNEWRPIVRMEWSHGIQIHKFIAANLRNKEVLEQLAEDWRKVIFSLRNAGMAHGDLQSGNILIENNQKIRLVDYDGIYIGSLHDDPPEESGHKNFQHPERIKNGYYAENVDNFSSIVIYLSLIAVIEDQTLWRLFHNEADNLIFVSEDFKNFARPIWEKLRRNRDSRVRNISMKLEDFCKKQVSNIPDLETVLNLSNIITVTCPLCKYNNKAEEICCQKCSNPLYPEQDCPYCRNSIIGKSIYCPICGNYLMSSTWY